MAGESPNVTMIALAAFVDRNKQQNIIRTENNIKNKKNYC